MNGLVEGAVVESIVKRVGALWRTRIAGFDFVPLGIAAKRDAIGSEHLVPPQKVQASLGFVHYDPIGLDRRQRREVVGGGMDWRIHGQEAEDHSAC